MARNAAAVSRDPHSTLDMTADACRCKRPGCPAGPNFPTQMLFQFSSACLGARDVTIVRGQQGTAEWQQHRCGKIGGSMAYACAHATAHNRKVNLCAQLCQCVKRSAPTDAMRWGTNHEKAALLQYMICMTITGQDSRCFNSTSGILHNIT